MSIPSVDPSFEGLLDYLRQSRGFDFTGYKRQSLIRRVQKRLEALGLERYDDYMEFLEVHAEEFATLFNTVLINVTGFFRDPQAWEYLQKTALPPLIERKRPEEGIRVWSAGCASGEEAYSLAIVLAECLGPQAFQARVKIYATDVDDDALVRARQGIYSARDMTGVPADLVEKYFEPSGERFLVRKDLRRVLIFGRNDLVQDAPISRVDILVCRNTLMYFNAETQSRILTRFHFGLTDGGLLFVGRAETLLSHGGLFTPCDLKHRVFMKLPRLHLRSRLGLLAQGPGDESGMPINHARLRNAALDAAPLAQILVDRPGFLVYSNGRARSLFNISSRDLGRPLQDLQLSYRPAELRSCIERAYLESRPVVLRDVNWASESGETRWFDISVEPISDAANGASLGISIIFTDVSRTKRLQQELEQSNHELETAYEEMQSTVEELETTNEEVQSTVEELETTNEELQSTNEELETMNEELQSTNEEFQSINDELRQRSEELNQLNTFMEAILSSLRGAVVVLDRDLRILVWNESAVEMWGLRADEVRGKSLMDADIGIDMMQLRPAAWRCLSRESSFEEATIPAVNRRGRHFNCGVRCTPLMSQENTVIGVILIMEEATPTNVAAD